MSKQFQQDATDAYFTPFKELLKSTEINSDEIDASIETFKIAKTRQTYLAMLKSVKKLYEKVYEMTNKSLKLSQRKLKGFLNKQTKSEELYGSYMLLSNKLDSEYQKFLNHATPLLNDIMDKVKKVLIDEIEVLKTFYKTIPALKNSWSHAAFNSIKNVLDLALKKNAKQKKPQLRKGKGEAESVEEGEKGIRKGVEEGKEEQQIGEDKAEKAESGEDDENNKKSDYPQIYEFLDGNQMYYGLSKQETLESMPKMTYSDFVASYEFKKDSDLVYKYDRYTKKNKTKSSSTLKESDSFSGQFQGNIYQKYNHFDFSEADLEVVLSQRKKKTNLDDKIKEEWGKEVGGKKVTRTVADLNNLIKTKPHVVLKELTKRYKDAKHSLFFVDPKVYYYFKTWDEKKSKDENLYADNLKLVKEQLEKINSNEKEKWIDDLEKKNGVKETFDEILKWAKEESSKYQLDREIYLYLKFKNFQYDDEKKVFFYEEESTSQRFDFIPREQKLATIRHFCKDKNVLGLGVEKLYLSICDQYIGITLKDVKDALTKIEYKQTGGAVPREQPIPVQVRNEYQEVVDVYEDLVEEDGDEKYTGFLQAISKYKIELVNYLKDMDGFLELEEDEQRDVINSFLQQKVATDKKNAIQIPVLPQMELEEVEEEEDEDDHIIEVEGEQFKKILREVKNLEAYQVTKPYTNGVNSPIIAYYPNYKWSIDLININFYGLPFKHILSVIDVFSKKCWIEKMLNKTSEGMLHAFVRIIYRANVFPACIMCDNGGEFQKYMLEWCKNRRIDERGNKQPVKIFVEMENHDNLIEKPFIKIINTLSFSPRSNGVVENLNQFIRRLIRKMIARHKNSYDWIQRENMLEIENVKNNMKNSITKLAPNQIWTPRPLPVDSEETSVKNMRAGIFLENALQRQALSRLMIRAKSILSENVNFEVGDVVRVKMSSLYSTVRQTIKEGNKKNLTKTYSRQLFVVDKKIQQPEHITEVRNSLYQLSTLIAGRKLSQQIHANTKRTKKTDEKNKRYRRLFGNELLLVIPNDAYKDRDALGKFFKKYYNATNATDFIGEPVKYREYKHLGD